MQLAPVGAQNGSGPPPDPAPEIVATWEIHASRKPVSRDTLTQAIVAVQKKMGFATGLRYGNWSAEATERLKVMLARPKRGYVGDEEDQPPKKKQKAFQALAAEASGSVEGQPQGLLALEDGPTSTPTASKAPEATPKPKAKGSSSSSSSS